MLIAEHPVLDWRATGMLLALLRWSCWSGAVLIRERQVGIVVKKFGARSLPPGRLHRAGRRSRLPGRHARARPAFRLLAWQYRIIKVPVTVVPQGEIALVVAADGAAIPAERILGKVVDCDNFQDARKFLLNGGEKGRQLGILTAGTYRINTALFTVITVGHGARARHGAGATACCNASSRTWSASSPRSTAGRSRPARLPGRSIAGHDNFQNAQAFLDGGGRRGLQEQILLSGTWNLNPWFVAGRAGADGADSHRLRRRGHLVRRQGARGRQRRRVQARRPGERRPQRRLGDAAVSGQTPDQHARDEGRTRAHDQHRAQLGHPHRGAPLRREAVVDHGALEGRLRLQPRRGADHPRRRARRAEGDLARRLDAEPGGSRPAADCRKLFPQLGAGLHGARLPERAQPAPGRGGRAHPRRARRPTTCRPSTRSSATSIRRRS